MGRLRVLIADDNDSVRAAVGRLLEERFEIVGAVSTGRELVDAALAQRPDVIVSDLDMDLITRKVTRAGTPVELTVREFELLEYLMRHGGQVVSRETLARDVWKETARTTPLDNVIDVHIARLRRKIDLEGTAVKLIHTVRGVGFMLREGEP